MQADIKPRLTTAEAAERLGCSQSHALHLLRAANISHTRSSRRGLLLWDAEEVQQLTEVLKFKSHSLPSSPTRQHLS
jgi:excisionase family DNA binding protein